MGKLFLVSTPIGNLEDITLRALKVLANADLILAEDTRSTQTLLSHHQVKNKKLLSFFEGNEQRRIPEVLARLAAGEDIALVSESGTPLISDPGFKLVREAIKNGFSVELIPGPTALISALVVSGLPTSGFIFLGFLPKKEGKITSLFKQIKSGIPEQTKTIIFYESPHRLLKTLHLAEEVFGEVDIVTARELTKIHEEIRREAISSAIDHFTQHPPRGEFVVLLSLQQNSAGH